MKAFAILPVAAAAILALNVSGAFSQGVSQAVCQKEFQACMDGCTTRSSKGLQDSCFTSCEGRNNICAERVYGKRPFNGSPSTAAEQKTPGKDALAKDAMTKTEKEPEQPQAAESAPAPAPAPEQRAPARAKAR